MATDTNKAQAFAQAMYDALERKNRDAPNEYGCAHFYSLKSGSPEWMQDVIREAHDSGGIMPNDWVYDACQTIVGGMSDTDPDEWDDSVSEWADCAVDVYNRDRAVWLASNLAFGEIVDDAVAELGHSEQGIYGDIGIGQYRFLEQIAYALVEGVKRAARLAEDESED